MSSATLKSENTENVREQILKAALNRFSYYGFKKTTMAEIAQDCGMSAANLYRYFESKQEIGAALAAGCMQDAQNCLRKIVESDVSAAERLRLFVLEVLRDTHHHFSEAPRISEMVEMICSDRREVLLGHMGEKRKLMAALIEEGNRRGEFSVNDPDSAAQAVLAAMVVFDAPVFMGLCSLEEFEQTANNLVDLLVNGLVGR